MNVKWEYHKEEFKKGKRDHINHLWYVSTIDETDVEYGVEAEVFSTDNGPFNVTFYKGDVQHTPIKIKTKQFKTLPAAKRAAQRWISSGLAKYIDHMDRVLKAVSSLSCE